LLGFKIDLAKLDENFGTIESSGHSSVRIVFLHAAARIRFRNYPYLFQTNKHL
jgi:hypothetical protein